MGALIEAFATVRGHHEPFHRGALKLADAAIATCLERAGRAAADLDLLINAGVYRDDNLGEPALAALIQEDVGANLRRSREAHGTFSFDVSNGGAGVITGLYLLDGFLEDSIDLGLVVASDAHPGGSVEPVFPFAHAGGAMLLVPGGADVGFVGFAFDTYPEFESLFSARLYWEERRLRGGHNVLLIDEAPGYAERAVECAVASTRRFLARFGMRPRDVDLVIPSQLPGRFPDTLGRRLEIAGDRIARVGEDLRGVHTAGPIAALEAAEQSGLLAEAEHVLFVAVGAGISVGMALYRRPG